MDKIVRIIDMEADWRDLLDGGNWERSTHILWKLPGAVLEMAPVPKPLA